MMETIWRAVVLLLAGTLGQVVLGQVVEGGGGPHYPDPSRFEAAIQRFEEADAKQMPPVGAIVAVGSSSMRGWHGTIAGDLAPLTIIPRGFGGSNMHDALHFVDRIVLPYRPRAVVVYEGDNDIAGKIAPAKIAETFRALAERVHQELPECRIYVLSIKPSPSRWHGWPAMQEANRLLAAACAEDVRLTFVDVATPMLDEEGKPRAPLYQKDNLHLTRAGYELWRDVLRPILLPAEQPFEPAAVD